MKKFQLKNFGVEKGLYLALFSLLFLLIGYYISVPHPFVDDGYFDGDQRQVGIHSPFTVHFNQSMNRKSVESSFKITPSLKGEFEWLDSSTLQYKPNESLKIGAEYEVTIGMGAKNSFFKSLKSPLELDYVVSGAPYAKFISPYLYDKDFDDHSTKKDSILISSDQKITVMFDRPIRPLESIADESTVPLLKIEPPVQGSYKWLGSTAFQFMPKEWALGTDYLITLPSGIQSIDGGKTEDEIQWKLSTEAVQVVSTDPSLDYDAASPFQNIRIQFNQPIDLDDIKPGKNILLYPSNDVDSVKNKRLDGFFNTSVSYGQNDKGSTDKSVLLFKPEFPFEHHRDYRLVIKEGLKTLALKKNDGYGGRSLEKDYELTFKTVKRPGIADAFPKNNEKSYRKGYVSLHFNSPISEEELRDKIKMNPAPEKLPTVDLYEQLVESETRWVADIYYDLVPSQSYEFEFKGPYKDLYGNESKDSHFAQFKTAPKDSFLSLMKGGGVGLFAKGLRPFYTLKTVNIDRVDLALCPVNVSSFIQANSSYLWHDFDCSDHKKSIKINSNLNQSTLTELDLSDVFEKDFKEGAYYFQVTSDQYLDRYKKPKKHYQSFLVTDTQLTLKKSEGDYLVWATDLKTGKPIPNMRLKFISRDGLLINSGVTNKEGVYYQEAEMASGVYVIGEKNTPEDVRWSMTYQNWDGGIQSWQFNGLDGEWISNEPRVYLYTDRPLYKPSDEIWVKGIYRFDQDGRLSFPSEPKIKLVLEDPEYNVIAEKEVSILTDGSFSGSFQLAEKGRLGRYNLYATIPKREDFHRFYHHFFVEEYKKPIFKVNINSSKSYYLDGDRPVIDFNAQYFFGGALSESKYKWFLSREPYYHNSNFDRYFSFNRWGGFHCFWTNCRSSYESVSEGVGQLTNDGFGKIKLAGQYGEMDQSYLYTLEVVVDNKDGQQVTKTHYFVIHQDDHYAGLNTNSYLVGAGSDFELNVVSVDLEGNVVEGKMIDLSLYYHDWSTVKKQGVDGAFYKENILEKKLVDEKTIETKKEMQSVSFKMSSDRKSGQYSVVATTKAGQSSEISFFYSGDSLVNWGGSNHNRIELIPDKNEYLVGGKAKIMIKSPYGSKEKPAKALITYERSGIKNYEVIDITSGAHTIELPIDESMFPNVYVSAFVTKDVKEILDLYIDQQTNEVGDPVDFSLARPDFKMGTLNLQINDREHKIFINIKSNQDSYKIGEPVELSIYTKDYKNQPLSSVVSLSVVDQSLLALKANTKKTPLDYFFPNRTLQVNTASNLTIHANRVNVNSAKGAKGGDGGSDEALYDKKRGEFKDTAYFNPLIKTNKDGFAKIKFMPPDNLTTWQMWAVASSGTDKFGSYKKDFDVRKEISIHPILPSFMISGDQMKIGASVHNGTEDPLSLRVKLGSDAFLIDGSNKKVASVEPGKTKKIYWNVKVNKFLENEWVDVEFESKKDSVIKTIPVYSFAFPEVVALSSEWQGESSSEKIKIPTGVHQKNGSIKLRVGGNPILPFIHQLESLKNYPYSCAEQKASQLLPILLLKLKGDSALLNSVYLDEEVSDDLLQSYVQMFSDYQHFDGGYSFWKHSESSHLMLTSYILQIYKLAEEVGLTINSNEVNRALQYLWNELNRFDKEISIEDQVYALWILSEYGQNDTGFTLSLFESREAMPLFTKGILLMNLNNLVNNGQASVRRFVQKLKSEIAKSKVETERAIHFEESLDHYDQLNTDRRTTAILLYALTKDSPENPILPKLFKYLSSSGDDSYLLNTQESAWVLLSALEYVDSKMDTVDTSFEVKLDGKSLMKGVFDSKGEPPYFEKEIGLSDLEAEGALNTFQFKKKGEGDLNYDIEMRYFIENRDIQAAERGFYIARQYYELDDKELLSPVTKMKSGEIYRGVLHVISPENRHQVVVEERLPAGLEAINFNLDNTQRSLQLEVNEYEHWYDNPLWHFNHKEVASDRVLLFADHLKKGVYKYEFLVRAGLPGRYQHLPAAAYQMYFPEVFGRTTGQILEVSD